MESSIGKALREARLKKKLTVEDVARQTRIPLNRVIDLEKDEYAHFPSLAYARNFVLLYSRFLGVDTAQYPLIDVGNPTVSSDYQYLQRSGPQLRLGPRLSERRPKRKKTFWVLLIFLAAILTGVFVAVFIIEAMRLPAADQLVNRDKETPEVTPSPSPSASPSPTPEAEQAPGGEPAMSGIAAGSAAPQPSEDALSPSGDPGPSPEEAEAVSPAEPTAPVNAGAEPSALGVAPEAEMPAITPTPSPTPALRAPEPEAAAPSEEAPEENRPFETPSPTPLPTPTPSATPAAATGLKEIRITVTKRGRLRVVQDNRNSKPVYDQNVTPGQRLVFRGNRFWVQASDPSGIKVSEKTLPSR